MPSGVGAQGHRESWLSGYQFQLDGTAQATAIHSVLLLSFRNNDAVHIEFSSRGAAENPQSAADRKNISMAANSGRQTASITLTGIPKRVPGCLLGEVKWI